MRTLLLADDSVTTQRVVALTFADESFRVVTVSDGQQAIEAMAAMRPDIVLAGTTLPRTNGYELCEHMRDDATLRDVPVLLLSGAFESVDTARLKVSGAKGVIEKPLEPTAVISRVRELLGLKDTRPAPPAGRLVTTADTASDRRPAAAPQSSRKVPASVSSVSSWDELRQDSGLAPDAPSVEGGAGREDYLDTLDAAFDSLDQHLAGRHDPSPLQRNPSPPIGQAAGAPDPRSPGRRPSPSAGGGKANSVFEVDDDWFADDKKARDVAARQEIVADARDVMPGARAAAPARPVFEVDDDWFAEDGKAPQDRGDRHRDLAAEMGIRDLDLPAVDPQPDAPAPAAGLDFDFGLDDLLPPREDQAAPAPAAPAAAPVAPQSAPPPVAPGSVADDFAALLAFETGDAPPPPVPAPTAGAPSAPVAMAAPEITDAMFDQIAERVADRLNAGTFGTHLRDSMASAVRDTVRSVVSETSERLVRDEIARIKSRAERETP